MAEFWLGASIRPYFRGVSTPILILSRYRKLGTAGIDTLFVCCALLHVANCIVCQVDRPRLDSGYEEVRQLQATSACWIGVVHSTEHTKPYLRVVAEQACGFAPVGRGLCRAYAC